MVGKHPTVATLFIQRPEVLLESLSLSLFDRTEQLPSNWTIIGLFVLPVVWVIGGCRVLYSGGILENPPLLVSQVCVQDTESVLSMNWCLIFHSLPLLIKSLRTTVGIILVCNLASKNVLVIFTSNINPVLTQLGVFLKWRVKPHLEESVIRKFNKLVFFLDWIYIFRFKSWKML